MADAPGERELEENLLEAGNKLLEPPAPVDDLLPLLDRVENYLSRVEQSPPKSMQVAIDPSKKALVAEQLLRHSHLDVRVGVASCVTEITRITAPDAPYTDDKMKEVFQLIVSAFENLADNSSRSYVKRTSMLETVAKVRSVVIMMDLELDAMIVEMIEHFLKSIRDYHPESVLKSMETIMMLVLDESEEISLELLYPLLACVKKDNEEALPIARRLAESVLEKRAPKIKSHVSNAVKSLGHSPEDYSEVVVYMCQLSIHKEENDGPNSSENQADENDCKVVEASGGEPSKVVQEVTEAGSEKADPAGDKSPNSVVSNGIKQTGEDDSLADLNSSKEEEQGNPDDKAKIIDKSSNAEPDSLGSDKEIAEEPKTEQYTKKKGKVPPSEKMTEPSEGSHIEDQKEVETQQDDKSTGKDVPSSPQGEPAVMEAVASENDKETGNEISTAKETEGESTHVPPSPSGSILDEKNAAKRGDQQKIKESSDAPEPVVDVSKKASEGASDQGTKQRKHSRKKAPSGSAKEEKTPNTVNASKKDSDVSGDSEAKLSRQLVKKVDGNSKNKDRSSSKKTDEKKKGAKDKTVSGKDVAKSSIEDDKETVSSLKSASKSKKDEHRSEKTPKTNSKRKHTSAKASDVKEYDESLIGLRVKVYWPEDKMFYEGVIESFDAVKKKHKVSYDDGDVEILNLKKEKWKILGNDSESDGEHSAEHEDRDASSGMRSKKKSRTGSEQSTKQGKIDTSSKKAGGASSSKTKAVAEKSGAKSKDKKKADDKSKEGTTSENENAPISKDQSAKSGSKAVTTKSASKAKSDAEETVKSTKSKEGGSTPSKASSKSRQETPKTGSKSKQETPKASSSAKGKFSKTAKPSGSNSTGKLKSSASKGKENDEAEESADSAGAPETKKRKSPSSSKAQESGAKSGKKRRRGLKN